MIIKFILLGSICITTPNQEIKCTQYIRDSLSDASECQSKAKSIGLAVKDKMLKLGGSMEQYSVQCIAIDSNGYNVDHSFNISYNIS